MRRLLLCALLVLAACAPSAASEPGFDPGLRAEIDRIMGAALADGVTGAVVAVHDGERGDLLAAYGTADTAGTPMTPDLHYRIASVTKTFTATAVLELADQGRLSLDDTLDEYVPDLPNGATITLRDLLAMRSGLYEYAEDPSIFGRYVEDPLLPGYTLDTGLAVVRAHATDSTPPDQKTVYTNTNYMLLGFVIEQAAGRPAPEYLEDLARRTGLAGTTFPVTPDLPAPYAHGYTLDGDPHPRADVSRSNTIYPWTAGAMVSTVPDMLAYAPRLAAGVGLDPATQQARLAWNPLTTSGIKVDYGLGLTRFGDWLGHDGSIYGYSDVVVHRPESDTTIVIMVNGGDGEQVPAVPPFVEIARLLHPDSLPTY